jgi:hypothetical protein
VIKIEELEAYDKQDQSGELTDKEAKRAKFRLLGPLGQGHNIVVHIRASASRTDEFRKLARRIIPLDNRTR